MGMWGRKESSLMQASRFSEESIVRISDVSVLARRAPGSLPPPRSPSFSGEREMEKSRVRSLFSRWYRPTYDDNPELTEKERKASARYCGGRLKKWQFILLNTLFLSLFISAILLPISYFIIIPEMIRAKVESLPLNTMQMDYMNLTSVSDTSLSYSTRSSLPKQMWIPIQANIGATELAITMEREDGQRGEREKELLRLQVPALDIWIHKPVELELEGQLSFLPLHWPQVSQFIEKISAEGGLKEGTTLSLQGNLSIGVFGLTLYPHFPITKKIVLPSLQPSVLSLFDNLPSFFFNSGAPTLSLPNVMHQFHLEREQLWAPLEGFSPLAIKALAVNLTDFGPEIRTTIVIRNPTVLNVGLQKVEVGLSLEGALIGRMGVGELALRQGVNEYDLSLSMNLMAEGVDPEQVSKAVSSAIKKVLLPPADGEKERALDFAIVGPLSLDGKQCWTEMTAPLRLSFPISEILDNANVRGLAEMLSLGGVKKMLGDLELNLDVQSEHIVSPISLPVPLSIPLPPLDINYNVSLDIHAPLQEDGEREERRLLSLSLSGLHITSKDSHLQVGTSVVIRPVNTEKAADLLAATVQPMLRGEDGSSVDIASLHVRESKEGGEEREYTWSRRLFQDTTISFPLPGMNIVELLGNMTENFSSLPVGINSMLVRQMRDRPGFECDGAVSLSSIPNVNVNLGFASVDIQAETAPLLAATLPSGLLFSPSQSPESMVRAFAVFQHSPDLSGALQRVVDSFLASDEEAELGEREKEDKSSSSLHFSKVSGPSLGITGIRFGPKEDTAFVTFSKIRVDIPIAKIRDLAAETVRNAVKAQKITVNGLDMGLKPANVVSVSLNSSFQNALNVSMEIGTITVDVGLEGDGERAMVGEAEGQKQRGHLVSVQMSPLKIPMGTSNWNIKTDLALASGARGMKEKMAAFLPAVLYGDRDVPTSVVIRNIRLSPASGSPSSSSTSPADIDQLSSLELRLSGKTIRKYNPLHTKDGEESSLPVDLSPVLPKSFASLLSSFSLKDIHSAELATKAGEKLDVNAAFSYSFGLNLKADVPSASVLLAVDDTKLLRVSLSSLSIEQEGTMKPQLGLDFSLTDKGGNGNGQTEEERKRVAEKIAEIVNSLLQKGQVSKDLEVREIYFGASSEDENDLLSATSILLPTAGTDAKNFVPTLLSKLLVPALPLSSLSSLGVGLISVKLKAKPRKSMDLGTELTGLNKLLKPKISMDLGYVQGGVDLSSSPFLSFLMAKGLQMGSGKREREGEVMALDMGLQFRDNEETAVRMSQLVSNFLSGSALSSSLSLAGLYLGADAKDVITAFSLVSVSIDLDRVIGPGREPISLSQMAVDFVKQELEGQGEESAMVRDLRDLRFATQPLSSFLIGALVTVDMGFKVDMDLGYAGAGVSLDGTKAFSASLSPFGVSSSPSATPSSVNISALLRVHDEEEELADRLGAITEEFGRSGKWGGRVEFGRLLFGASSTPADLIQCFSLIAVPLSLQEILPPVIDNALSKLPLPISSMEEVKDKLGLEVGRAAVETRRQKTLGVQGEASFRNPFPVAVDVGYLSTSVSIQAIPGHGKRDASLLSLALPSLTLLPYKPGNQSASQLKLDMAVRFEEEPLTAPSVARAVQNFLGGGPLATRISAGNLHIGYSAEDYVRSFRKMKIPVDLDRIIRVSEPIDLTRKVVQVVDGMVKGEVNGTRPAVLLQSAAVDMRPQDTLGLQAALTIDLGAMIGIEFPVAVSLGHLKTGLSLDDVDAFTLRMSDGLSLSLPGEKKTGGEKMELKGEVQVHDTESLAGKLETIVAAYNKNSVFPGSLSVGSFVFGVSEEDSIQAFSAILLPLSLDPLVQPVLSYALSSLGLSSSASPSSGGLSGLVSAVDLDIGYADIETKPGKKLDFKTEASFIFPFPSVSLSVGFFGTGIGINQAPLLDVRSLSPLTLSSSVSSLSTSVLESNRTHSQDKAERRASNLSLSLSLEFNEDGRTAGEVKKVAESVILGHGRKSESQAVVSSLVFGFSSEDYIRAFHRVKLELDLDKLLEVEKKREEPSLLQRVEEKLEAAIEGAIYGGKNGTTETPLSLRSLSLSALPRKSLSVAALAEVDLLSLLGLPFPLSLSLGYATADIGFDSVEGFHAALGDGLKLKREEKEIALGATVAVKDTLELREKLGQIFETYSEKGVFPGQIALSGLTFGASADGERERGETIKALSLVQIPLNLNKLVRPLARYVGDYVDSLLKRLGEQEDVLSSLLQALEKGEKMQISDGLALTLSGLDCAFAPASRLDIATAAVLTTPWNLTASLPLVGLSLGLDSLSFLSLDVLGLSLLSSGKENPVDLKVVASFGESQALIEQIGVLSRSFLLGEQLKGNVRMGGAKVGGTDKEEDVILAFSKVFFSLELERLLSPLLRGLSAKKVDVLGLMEKFKLQIGDVALKAETGRALSTSLSASMDNTLPVSLAGLGYFALPNVGVDSVKILEMQMKSPLSLSRGVNHLEVSPRVSFTGEGDGNSSSSLSLAQEKVAALVKALLNERETGLDTSLTVQGVSFGINEKERIRTFEKLSLSLPAASLLNRKLMDVLLHQLTGLNSSSSQSLPEVLMDRLGLESANIDAAEPGALTLDAAVSFRDILPRLSIDFPFLSLSISLDGTELGSLSISEGFHLGPVGEKGTGNSSSPSLFSSLKSKVHLLYSDALAAAVAKVIQQLQSLDSPLSGTAGVMKLRFGFSPEDNISLFSLADLAFSLSPFLSPVRKKVHEIAEGVAFGTNQHLLTSEDLSFSIPEGEKNPQLRMDGKVKVAGLPQKFRVNLPFISMNVAVNGREMMLPRFSSMTIDNGGEISFSSTLPISPDRSVMGDFFNLFVDMAFHRNLENMKATVSVSSLKFGYDESSSFSLAKAGVVSVVLDRVLREAWTFFDEKRPMEFDELRANCVPAGADAYLTVLPFKGPILSSLSIRIPSLLGYGYFKGDTVIGEGWFSDIKVEKGKGEISFKILVLPVEPGIGEALQAAVPRLLQWKSFTEDISLGGVTVFSLPDGRQATPEYASDMFSSMRFLTPPLYLFSPLRLRPHFRLFPLELRLDIGFHNGGPLYADVSDEFYVRVKNREKTIVDVSITSPLIIHNSKSNGGNTLISALIKPTFSILDLPRMLFDLFMIKKRYSMEFEAIKQKETIDWLGNTLNHVPGAVFRHLIPIIISLFKHTKLGGLPRVDQIPTARMPEVEIEEGEAEGDMPSFDEMTPLNSTNNGTTLHAKEEGDEERKIEPQAEKVTVVVPAAGEREVGGTGANATLTDSPLPTSMVPKLRSLRQRSAGQKAAAQAGRKMRRTE